MGIERFSHDDLKAIKKLQKLKGKIGSEDAEPRIEFAKTLLSSGLYQELISHELMDKFNISARDLDTCFEMGDGSTVVHGIVQAALKDQFLKEQIDSTGSQVWKLWHETYEFVEKANGAINQYCKHNNAQMSLL